ncbi:MAG: hypothetical protein E7294_09840 [Lachnospiraceae bacterium]|jgi:hypothetical protein|nr:hypothetical protein [Lachnospiraceae bacterium]
MAQKERPKKKKISKKKRRQRRLMITAGITLTALLCVYIGVALYFNKHFAFNTYVNGKEAYKKTPKDFEEDVLSGIGKYTLTVHARGNVTQKLTSQDLKMVPQLDGQFDEILKTQNSFAWPGYLFHETQLTTDIVVDYPDSALEEVVKSMKMFNAKNIILPKNAYVSEVPGESGYTIVSEENGVSPIRDKVMEQIREALDIMENEVTLTDECYETASVKSDDPTLTALCQNLNQYCKVNLTYEFGDDTVVVDGKQVREWCDIEGTTVTLNEEKVREFVNGLAKKYDTFGRTRSLRTHSGEVLKISGGDYGWWMNRDAETAGLIEAIKNGDRGVRTPEYRSTAVSYGENDWGSSYVEINLTAQHLWVYKDGSVVEESDFVSGCVNKGTTTPRGTYGITYKERDATLNGENYSSPVSYWMPFNGNVGMHDASWRSEFGGKLYVTNGSHGCINLPTSKAASIYDKVEKGEAVFVYGGLDTPQPEETEPAMTPEQQAILQQQQIQEQQRQAAEAAAAAAAAAAGQNAETVEVGQ